MGMWVSQNVIGKKPRAVRAGSLAAVVAHAVRINLKGASGSARSTVSLSELLSSVQSHR